MFERLKAWWKRVRKKETKGVKKEIYIPKFLFPESRERYLQLYKENRDTEHKNILDGLASMSQEIEALRRIETNPVLKELNHRKANSLQKNVELLKVRASMLDIYMEKKTQSQIQTEEAAKIMAEGITLSKSFKPKHKVCRDVRMIVQYERRIFLLCYFLAPVMKEAEDGTKKKIPTGDFLPGKLDWITDSLSQLSTDELEMLQAKGIICANN